MLASQRIVAFGCAATLGLFALGCRTTNGAKAKEADGSSTSAPRAPACPAGAERRDLTFPSTDGLAIRATFDAPCKGQVAPVVVLAHQMCQSRAEWRDGDHDWIARLGARGIATLSIDLRGHGESKAWPDGSSHDLCAEIQNPEVGSLYAGMVHDVEAAITYAKTALGASRVALVGSSIGANASLVAFAEHDDVRAVVALSPGENYREIRPGAAVARAVHRPIALLAADDDANSAEAVRSFGAVSAEIHARVLPSGGHGNKMFEANPLELDAMVGWLAGHIDK